MNLILLDYWPLTLGILTSQLFYALYRLSLPKSPSLHVIFIMLAVVLMLAGYLFMAVKEALGFSVPLFLLPVALGLCFTIYKLIMASENKKRTRLAFLVFAFLSALQANCFYNAYDLLYVPHVCSISSDQTNQRRLAKLFDTHAPSCLYKFGPIRI